MENIEIWKDIPEYEGLYQISNWGKVKSLPRNTTKGGILKPRKNRGGYLQLQLTKNGIRKTFTIHKLVALAFIPNPENLPCVNHKDENKENNHVENLEFCSISYNNCYGSRIERMSKNISLSLKGKYVGKNHWCYGKHHSEETKQKLRKPKSEEHKQKIGKAQKGKPRLYKRKPILQYTLEGEFIREWENIKQASEELNLQHSNIGACCRGKRNQCGNFIWKYKYPTNN